ncbi:hypothetical protein ACWD0Z_04625 [Streptomyces sp. NPDC003007]
MRAPAATVAERISPGAGIIEATTLDSCLLTISGDSLSEIAMHLALLGHDFVVHEPTELVEEVGRLANRLGRAHRASAR